MMVSKKHSLVLPSSASDHDFCFPFCAEGGATGEAKKPGSEGQRKEGGKKEPAVDEASGGGATIPSEGDGDSSK